MDTGPSWQQQYGILHPSARFVLPCCSTSPTQMGRSPPGTPSFTILKGRRSLGFPRRSAVCCLHIHCDRDALREALRGRWHAGLRAGSGPDQSDREASERDRDEVSGFGPGLGGELEEPDQCSQLVSAQALPASLYAPSFCIQSTRKTQDCFPTFLAFPAACQQLCKALERQADDI